MVIDIFISGFYVYTYCSYLAETYRYDFVKLRADRASGLARQGEAGSKMLFYQGVAIVIQLFGKSKAFYLVDVHFVGKVPCICTSRFSVVILNNISHCV